VLAGAGDYPDRPALIDAPSGRRLNYRDVCAQVERFAGALAQLGVGKGGVVAIVLPNMPEYPVVFLGTAMAGAASTTLNPTCTSREIAAQLADSGASVVVTTPGRLDKTRTAAAPDVPLVVLGEGSGDAIASTTCCAPPGRRRRSMSMRTSPRCRTRVEPPACPRV
jgi:acyl-CoA synthetase (AMP-forming)/AMP-acid ligase II